MSKIKAKSVSTKPIVIDNKPGLYGLEATDNSKAGPAFALPPEDTCDCATNTCSQVCYKKVFTYNSSGSIAKRAKNLRTVELLLSLGGPELLAKALIELVDEYKPKDWFIAQTTGTKTARPWSFRIHDLGDYPEFRTIPTVAQNDRKARMVSRIDPPP
jgi:hypothetical protein